MHILLLNGSPRKGNTKLALETIEKGLANHFTNATIEHIDVCQYQIGPCHGCDGCRRNDNTCVFSDDAISLTQKIYQADILIFGSPVYWWGITAQLKTLVDRMYAKGPLLAEQNKKIALILVGEAEANDPQYPLIGQQFQYICDYLGWNFVYQKAISAALPNDLAKQSTVLEELSATYRMF